jgi:hypothetical protein
MRIGTKTLKNPYCTKQGLSRHPEPYGGSADLEKFEVFITGILRWLSMNNMLGEKLQLGYLGACLKDEALEWFSRNVEKPDHIIRDWTRESAVAGLQQSLLHTLTHRQASNKFESLEQDSKTVQELLNNLTKYTACMISMPDEYIVKKRFLTAMRSQEAILDSNATYTLHRSP